jgi:hypothetical protein
VFHGGTQLNREPPVRHQDHSDHERTSVSRSVGEGAFV